LRVSAVSYLNTWPLVWGFLHGPGRGRFDFRFDSPAECARALAEGEADIGLAPCAEIDRLGLSFLPDVGIACTGPVRSILLISKSPFEAIRTLAADSSSRTSVALARILLGERYGCVPEVVSRPPSLPDMMAELDAALIIGDPALRIRREEIEWRSLDLGEEWVQWTGLPMVFAVWCGKKSALTEEVRQAFVDSYRWGAAHTDEVVEHAVHERGFPDDVARDYIAHRISYELTDRHREGLNLFRTKVRELDLRPAHAPLV
jgi:predicted solute-binding protein